MGPPLHRMYLRRKNAYQQHNSLCDLEADGNMVFYVTSQIGSHSDLSAAYASGTILQNAAAIFSPGEIILPDTTDEHWLCFEPNGIHAFLYSNEGQLFERKYFALRNLSRALSSRCRRRKGNIEALEKLSVRLSRTSPAAAEIASRCEHPAAKASVLAFLVLDAQLTFFSSSDLD